MKPETLEAIKAEAEKYAYHETAFGKGVDMQEKRDYIAGATKYAALLESEREKSEKLALALEEIRNPIKFLESRLKEGETLNGINANYLSTNPHYLKEIAEKALTEYKTTSK